MTSTLRTTRLASGPSQAPWSSRWKLRNFVVCLLLTTFALNSSAGLVTPDTKLDLSVDPQGFLARALHLWDAQGFAGQLQDQAYGYLFPMGPFFWAGHELGIPAWVVQRLWWAALLCSAYLGVVVLCGALRIGSPATRMISGVAYACSPHILSLLGTNSIEILPMCVAPWVVWPLVLGSTGRLDARRAGLGCGIAVLCMGGVNAAADLAAVLPAVLWLATRRVTRDSMRLVGWAAVAAVLATGWWLLPLALLGRYSPDFLDYIEDARTTTSTTSLIESLRGTADWVAYLPSSGTRAGLQLLTDPALVAESMVVVCLGVAGLASRRTPHRLWLISCLGLGVIALTFGHGASVGAPFAGAERNLLDGVLAPVRNVHKFDALIRLPMVLGLAHVTTRLRWGRNAAERRITSAIAFVAVAAAVAATATPLIGLRLAATGSYSRVPAYWSQTAAWLRSNAAVPRALVVPASQFADYQWGRLSDEPFQPLAGSPWEVRNAIPLTPAGHIRMLDQLEAELATGGPVNDLSDYLIRNGIGYLVVRNDLDLAATQGLQPAVVHATLSSSPGLSRVASFGPDIGSLGSRTAMLDQGLQPAYPAVEVWKVAGNVERASATELSSAVQVSGGPESIAALQQQGVLGSQPAVLTGNSPPTSLGEVVLTDGLRRRETNVGGPSGQHSDTLAADEIGRLGRRLLDYEPFASNAHESVARYLGATSLTASGSASDSTNGQLPDPSAQPYSAFDGDANTAWRTPVFTAPVGQWLQIDFTAARSPADVTLTPASGARVTAVTVTTQAGAVATKLTRSGTQLLDVPGGSTSWLRVTIDATDATAPDAQVGITELAIAGVHVERTIVAPDDLPSGRVADAISFTTPADARNGCLLVAKEPQCAVGLARTGEDDAGLDRTFTLAQAAKYSLTGKVVPRAGPDLDRLISSAVRPAVIASASSQAITDPLAGPQAAVDGDSGTGWIAAASDRVPTITLSWPTPTAISALRITTASSLAATQPTILHLVSASGDRVSLIPPDGDVTFASLTTNKITLQLSDGGNGRLNVASTSTSQTTLGIGISEIDIPGVQVTPRATSDDLPVDVACGAGPVVSIDGRQYSTALNTTVAALRDLQPVSLTVCGSSDVTLGAGTHRLELASASWWTASSTLLTTGDAVPSSAPIPVRAIEWGSSSRTLQVGARPQAALITVDENVNAGWVARADGQRLRAVTIDGWQQGYLIPAGSAITVILTFAPERSYSIALIVGAVSVAVLVAGFLCSRRRRVAGSRTGEWTSIQVRAAVGVTVCVLAGGVVGAVVAVIIGSVLYGVSRLPGQRVRRAAAPVVAVTALVIASVELTIDHYGSSHYAANSTSEQVLGLIAIAATSMAGLDRIRLRR